MGNDDEAIAEINVVPLVDIILVVLIIFMVTAPLIMKPSISVNLPKASSGESSQTTQLTIILSGDGKLYLNDKEIDIPGVLAAAQAEVIKNPEIQAIISADKDVPHGKVVTVMDTVKQGGVKRFAISIEKKH
jgi:biopolymer transport protein ExbD